MKKSYALKKSEVYADVLALRDSKNFKGDLEKFLIKYETSGERGPRSTVKFDLLQKHVDAIAIESPNLTFSKLSLMAASRYNVKEGKRNPINPAFFQKWSEKGKIVMPVSPSKRAKSPVSVIETTASGEKI